MEIVILSALGLSVIAYLTIGFRESKHLKYLKDMLPVSSEGKARVNNSSEFSSSTVAVTISLATVVVAFFELAPYFGYWLFWTVFTTAIGIYIVRLLSKRIWQKISTYKTRPSIHEFLSTEYGSRSVGIFAAVATSLGFLGAFAVELTVGSRFLAALIPNIPEILVVLLLSATAFIYTAAGGFRAVIVTDRMQMFTIWGLILALAAYLTYYVAGNGGFAINYAKLPEFVTGLSWREGLTSFLIGIFLINVPTYIADMSIWQRIGGARSIKTVTEGLWKSVLGAATTWSVLIVLACFTLFAITAQEGVNPLITLLQSMNSAGVFGIFVLFVVILGLYGAMLSTASTQLITISHAISEDIVGKFENDSEQQRSDSTQKLKRARLILILSAIFAVGIVELLSWVGFSIADLVFAIFGSQLGMFIPVILALFMEREDLKKISTWCIIGVFAGFIAGWTAAIYGKITGDSNLVFLAPCFSLGASAIIVGIGFIFKK